MRNREPFFTRRYEKFIVQSRNLDSLKKFIKEFNIFAKRKISELNGIYEISKIINHHEIYKYERKISYLAGNDIWIFRYRDRRITFYRNYKQISYSLTSVLSMREHYSYDPIKSVKETIWTMVLENEFENEFALKINEMRDSKLLLSIKEELEKLYFEQLKEDKSFIGTYIKFRIKLRVFFEEIEPYAKDLQIYKNISYQSFKKICKIIEE